MGDRRLFVVAVAVAAVVVQHGLMPDVTLFGVHPDVLLLLTVVLAITGGADRGAKVGFAAGLATDLFLNTPLGLTALAYSVAGWTTGRLSREASDLPWTVGGFAALGTFIGVTLYVLGANFFGGLDVTFGRWLQVTAVLALLHALLSPIVAPVFERGARVVRGPDW